MNTSYIFNCLLFIINYFIIFFLSYNYLTRHIFHQNPLFFIIIFGIIGLFISISIAKIKVIIPIKVFFINIASSYISFLIFYNLYNNCIGFECKKNFIDHILITIHLFIILKFAISIIIITIIYFLVMFYTKNN